MSWRDRDYNRDDASYGYRGNDGGGGGFGGAGFSFGLGGGMTYMVKWLLIINIAIFVMDIFTNKQYFTAVGAFTYAGGVSHGQLWRWVTYQFLHADFLHIAMNMLGLFFFGPIIERYLGSRRFLAFYLLCGASGAWFYSTLGLTRIIPFDVNADLVGASGSLFGILAAAAVVAPNTTVQLLIPPIPMKLRTMVLIVLGIAAFTVFFHGNNAGGQAAHLGGAAFGYLLIRYPKSLNFAEAWGPGDFSDTLKRKRAEREQRKAVEEEEEVDRILAKVKKEGVGNLTEKEKDTLKRATERQNKAG